MSAATDTSSPLDRRITVTMFPNFGAATKREEMLTLHALAPRIRTTTGPVKGQLPWLKLAKFGTLKTDKGSLRHDKNVISISGVEGDYDAEVTTVDEAVAMLRKANVAGMIYTSPSHTEDAPRWRVLCPLSQEWAPEHRTLLLARLNGVFHGGLSGESFTLSQSYYFGSVNRSPSHRVEVVEGAFLDERLDLDASAVGKSRVEYKAPLGPPPPRTQHTDRYVEAVLRRAIDRVRSAPEGQKHHVLRAQARVLGGYQHIGGFSTAEAIEWLVAALPSTAKDLRAARQTAAWGLESGASQPLTIPELVHAQENPPPPETPSDPDWFESLARSLEWEPADPAEVAEVDAKVAKELSDGEISNGGIIDPREWTAPAPLRQWLVQDWIPIGYATGLYGDGGLGKSLLLQQLLTSVATGRQWLNMDVVGGPAFGFMCEDDPDELHRRQEAINQASGVFPSDLSMLRYTSRLGLDNILMTFDERNHPELTTLFRDLVKYLATFRPRLVVFDTLADIFGGEEVKRAHARQFVQGVAGNIARAFQCAVVVAGHPSASGLSTGSGTSGNTAWSNTFRSRLYLTAPKDDDADSDPRLLERKKANYSKRGEGLTIKWQAGAFVAEGTPEAKPTGLPPDAQAEVFASIDAKWKAGTPWSMAPQTKQDGRYLPLWIHLMFGLSEREAAATVNKWLAAGLIRTDVFDARTKARGIRLGRATQP